jgi:hypothetical protein
MASEPAVVYGVAKKRRIFSEVLTEVNYFGGLDFYSYLCTEKKLIQI